MAKRLVRRKLSISTSADVRHIVSADHENLDLGKEGVIEVRFARHIDQSKAVIKELNIYLRRYTKRRGVANIILRYLEYVAQVEGAVSPRSLRDYREHINRNLNCSLSTKSQLFGACRNFVRHFMASGCIPDEALPAGFPVPIKAAKKTFSELIGSDTECFRESLSVQINDAKHIHGLDDRSALTLAYCETAMRLIHDYSLWQIERWEKDWRRIESLTGRLTREERSSLESVSSFKARDYSGERTVDLALKILFIKFGREIPASTEWTGGIADFLKGRGWNPKRVCSAFFPTTVELGAFLAAALSHRILRPNVDSVAFGLYFGAVRPAFEKSFHSVFMDKHRGGASQKLLSSSDPLLRALVGLQEKLRKALPETREAEDYLYRRDAPMLVHRTPGAGRKTVVRQLDPSSTSHIVKRVIRSAAKQHELLLPLAGSGASGENFRPTHALIDRLSGRPDAQIKNDLDHKFLSTTSRYTDRVETQSVIMGKYQDFQQYLVEESASLKRTGSGYLCSQPVGGDCGELQKCFSCDAKRIVMGAPEVAAEWIAWSNKIRESSDRLQMNNPERWTTFWGMKLAEYQALIDQLDQRTFKKASELAAGIALPHLD